MTGKQFGKEYMELTEKDENLEWCLFYLQEVNEDYRTLDAMNAIRKELEKVQLRISEMECYEVVKRI
jgi:hypothetical protein